MAKKINLHFVFVLLAAVLWGTAGIFVRNVEGQIGEMQLAFCRALISSAIFAVIILVKDIKLFKIKLKDLWLFAAAGIYSIVLFNFSYYKTMSLTTLSVAAVLLYTAPFFVVIISLFLFREKLSSAKLVALIVAFLGCCLVTGVFNDVSAISGKAIAFGLLTGLGYALYTVFGELLIRRGYKTLTITFYIFLMAAIGSSPFSNVGSLAPNLLENGRTFLIVFLMAFLNTVLPYLFYTAGLRGVAPTTAPIIAAVEPVVATVVGVAIFGEVIGIGGVIGIILVLFAVVLLNISPLRLKASAKINLVLSIDGKRDDGYHTIDTVMQSVSLCDTVSVKTAKDITVKCNASKIAGQDNIAYKAAQAFFEFTKLEGGANIGITKRIPMAAGLGGGSADAAAVILALDKLYKTELKTEELEKIAIGLGADVPFFITGGTKRAEGIGDILTDINLLQKGYFILVKEGQKPSTAEMYKKLDESGYEKFKVENLILAIEKEDQDEICKGFGNSFEKLWENAPIKTELLKLDADAVCLSGSGPTFFAFYKNKKAAQKAYKRLKAKYKECFLVKPLKKAISIV